MSVDITNQETGLKTWRRTWQEILKSVRYKTDKMYMRNIFVTEEIVSSRNRDREVKHVNCWHWYLGLDFLYNSSELGIRNWQKFLSKCLHFFLSFSFSIGSTLESNVWNWMWTMISDWKDSLVSYDQDQFLKRFLWKSPFCLISDNRTRRQDVREEKKESSDPKDRELKRRKEVKELPSSLIHSLLGNPISFLRTSN